MTYRIFNGPVRKPQFIAKMSEVIYVTKQLVLQLRVVDYWDWTILIKCSCITLKAGSEVSKMGSNFLYHKAPVNCKRHLQANRC